MTGKLLVLAASAAMVCSPALAASAATAQLGAVSGSVMVSSGGKVAKASAAALKAGDRVIASADGKASVTYADGCVVKLTASSMLTVAAKSPCASGAGVVKSQPAQAMQGDTFGINNGYLAAGIFIVAGAALIAAADNNDNSPTTSP